jgi:hypothetical protein
MTTPQLQAMAANQSAASLELQRGFALERIKESRRPGDFRRELREKKQTAKAEHRLESKFERQDLPQDKIRTRQIAREQQRGVSEGRRKEKARDHRRNIRRDQAKASGKPLPARILATQGPSGTIARHIREDVLGLRRGEAPTAKQSAALNQAVKAGHRAAVTYRDAQLGIDAGVNEFLKAEGLSPLSFTAEPIVKIVDSPTSKKGKIQRIVRPTPEEFTREQPSFIRRTIDRFGEAIDIALPGEGNIFGEVADFRFDPDLTDQSVNQIAFAYSEAMGRNSNLWHTTGGQLGIEPLSPEWYAELHVAFQELPATRGRTRYDNSEGMIDISRLSPSVQAVIKDINLAGK